MNRIDMTLQHAGWARLENAAFTIWKPLLAVLRAVQEAQVRSELRLLSDHTLKDIGLRRSDIDRLFHP